MLLHQGPGEMRLPAQLAQTLHKRPMMRTLAPTEVPRGSLEVIAGVSRMLVDGGTDDALDDFRYLRLGSIVGLTLNSV